MTQYINKDALVAEIDRRIKELREVVAELGNQESHECGAFHDIYLYEDIRSFVNTLEVKEVDLYNNGWIDCAKQMPPETKQISDTLQGHREWTESDRVLVWDSMYGCSVDVTKNGKWMSEQRGGYTGQVVHGIIAWRPIPGFNEELL